MSTFDSYSAVPPDPVFAVRNEYIKDNNPNKINLGIGTYKTDEEKPYILNVVKKVEEDIFNDKTLNKEYLGQSGDKKFVKLSQELILGKNCKQIKDKSIAGIQSLSGTGALRVLMELIKIGFPNATLYVSNPTWVCHSKIINKAGLKEGEYRYYNPKTKGLDITGLIQDLDKKCNKDDWVLFHACAHNPTGVDPNINEWKQIADIIQKKKLNVIFDSAYQGFASGSLDKDSAAVRLFASRGMEFLIAQSYSKNLGLYGERVGCASVVTNNPSTAKIIQTQLDAIVRPMYSNPPKHGMEIVKRVLSDINNKLIWENDLLIMSSRIILMREMLRNELEKLKTPGKWNHITSQIGLFSFTGLNKKQCNVLTKKYHVYLLSNGRISMSGVTTTNVKRLAKAIDSVVRNIN